MIISFGSEKITDFLHILKKYAGKSNDAEKMDSAAYAENDFIGLLDKPKKRAAWINN